MFHILHIRNLMVEMELVFEKVHYWTTSCNCQSEREFCWKPI